MQSEKHLRGKNNVTLIVVEEKYEVRAPRSCTQIRAYLHSTTGLKNLWHFSSPIYHLHIDTHKQQISSKLSAVVEKTLILPGKKIIKINHCLPLPVTACIPLIPIPSSESSPLTGQRWCWWCWWCRCPPFQAFITPHANTDSICVHLEPLRAEFLELLVCDS